MYAAPDTNAQPLAEAGIGGFDQRFATNPAIPMFLRPQLTAGYIPLALNSIAPAAIEQNGPADTQVLAELAAVKAELQELKGRVSEVHDSLMQTQGEMEQSRSELSTTLARIETVFERNAELSGLGFPVSANPNVPDVEVTGSVSARLTPAEEKQLTKTEALIKVGDIAGARLLLEYATRPMTAAVAFKLAETYDPEQLARWRVVGVKSDPNKARELYKQAAAAGIKEAQQRLRQLGH